MTLTRRAGATTGSRSGKRSNRAPRPRRRHARTHNLPKLAKTMDDKDFVIAPDGHVLSEKELEEARRLDPPVSTGDAPDTRAATTQSIEIERDLRQIAKFDKRIEEHLSWRAKAKAAGKYVGDEDLDPDLLDLRRKKGWLERKIALLEQPPKKS